MVRVTGLEPVRQSCHWNLNPARLPFPTTPAYILYSYLHRNLYYRFIGLTQRLAADYLLLILLRLSSYSISSLFSEFLLLKSIAYVAFSGGR